MKIEFRIRAYAQGEIFLLLFKKLIGAG